MRCISIRQPWAWAILHAGKDVENRTWWINHRGPLLLHAAASRRKDEYLQACGAIRYRVGFDPPDFDSVPRGGIVGVMVITGVVLPLAAPIGSRSWHVPGHYGWQIGKSVALPFRPLRGALSLFQVELTPAERAACRSAGIAIG